MIKVINNFLPTIFFKKLNTIINDSNFQWYFNESNLKPNQPGYKKGKYYFTHNIYDENIGKMSEVFNVFEPILYFIDQKSKVNRLLKIKLNLYPNQNKKIYQAKHCDMVDQLNKPLTNIYTGILNFTTCNGGTKIDKKEYSSKQNEFIYFENNISHAGIVQTDTTIRIVLNINWL